MSFSAYTPKVRVQKPAPDFSGTAVVDGTFESMHPHAVPPILSLGACQSNSIQRSIRWKTDNYLLRHQPLFLQGPMARSGLRPHGLDFRLPYRDSCLQRPR
jgi:hypothetical protein